MITSLVKSAKKGDKDAFSKLILHYQNDLYRIARAKFGNKDDDINDAIQDTIISAYLSINTLEKINSFKSWLITILIHKCNNIYKKNTVHSTISLEENNMEEYLCTDGLSSNSNLEFDQLMNLLNYDERIVLLLHYSDGYTSKEIGKILNLNANTVRSKICRAKTKLSNYIKEDFYE